MCMFFRMAAQSTRLKKYIISYNEDRAGYFEALTNAMVSKNEYKYREDSVCQYFNIFWNKVH